MSKQNTGEMPLLDHLEELRWRIIKALLSIILFAVVGFIFSNNGLISNLSLDGAKISRIAK